MLASSSRILSRQCPRRLSSSTRRLSTATPITRQAAPDIVKFLAGGALFATLVAASKSDLTYSYNSAPVLSSGDILNVGTPIKETATGIMFPSMCNAMLLVGVGVRIKYVFVKVYAVGTYMDPIAMMAVKQRGAEAIETALLDPTYPRTIRIVMNRGLSIDKYTAAIVESIEPRMNGKELETLEEFKNLNPPVDLVEGAEIEMTIRGDTLLYKNAVGGVGSIKSRLFCEALCDVYYGSDPVSPTHKESVMAGIPKL